MLQPDDRAAHLLEGRGLTVWPIPVEALGDWRCRSPDTDIELSNGMMSAHHDGVRCAKPGATACTNQHWSFTNPQTDINDNSTSRARVQLHQLLWYRSMWQRAVDGVSPRSKRGERAQACSLKGLAKRKNTKRPMTVTDAADGSALFISAHSARDNTIS